MSSSLSNTEIQIALEMGHYLVWPLAYFFGKKLVQKSHELIDERANKVALQRAAEVRQELNKHFGEVEHWQDQHEINDERRFKSLESLILKKKSS